MLFGLSEHSRGGFTLLELLIAVAVIGMTAAIAAPRIGAVATRLSLQAAGRQVEDFARRAQAEAANRDQPVRLNYSAAQTVYVADGNAVARSMPADVSLSVSGRGAGALHVFPGGYITPHRVELRNAAGAVAVSFTGTGVHFSEGG